MFKTKNFWYITLFVILYLITAGSSFFHAVSFFELANNSWMSVILAFAFEIGQAAVLFSLLTSVKDRSRIMPWVLMTMFTLVQVVGNVFSSYKHIVLNSVEDLKYFKEPIFIWTNLPDQEATVIVTWAIGAILPIAALLLTSMITNYLSDQEEEKLKELENIHSNELTQAQHLKESDEDEPKVEDEEIPDDKEHTITFKDGEEIVRSITGKMGTYVSVPYVEKEGYDFLGWSLDGKKVTMPVDGIYDSDITYIALWEKKQQEEDKHKDNKVIEGDPIGEKGDPAEKYLTKEEIKQAEDLIKNGINENEIEKDKISHFINQ